jgi:hypothetical protein
MVCLQKLIHLLFKLELITNQAMRAGFTGGVVVDFPNSTKAKKYKYMKIKAWLFRLGKI